MKQKYLKRERVPCWHELSLITTNGELAFELRLRNDYVASLASIPPDAWLFASISKEYNVPFFSDFSANIGLNGCIIRTGVFGDFTCFQIPIPAVKKRGERCRGCNGTGTGRFGRCMSCFGEKYESTYDYQQCKPLQASLATLATLFSYSEIETDSVDPQLFTFRLGTEWKMSGMGIFGEFSLDLVRWLATKGDSEFLGIANKMHLVYTQMMGPTELYTDRDFPVIVHNHGRFHLSCPGNACGLDPDESYYGKEGRGYDYGPHNVDSPMQQFVLLGGLAALHDLAREEMKK